VDVVVAWYENQGMYPRPEAQPQKGATDSQAIELCAKWMRFLGARDTVIADPSEKVPCDLYSSNYLAWVDNQSPNVGTELVRRVSDISTHDGRRGLIFFRYGFSPFATKSASELNIALLRFTPESGELNGLNRIGRQICAGVSLLA
jgi:hypothetical protein